MNIEQKANTLFRNQTQRYVTNLKNQSEPARLTKRQVMAISKKESKKIAKEYEEKIRCQLDQEYAESKKKKVIAQPSYTPAPLPIRIVFCLAILYLFIVKPMM